MFDNNVSGVPVVDDEGRLLGIISEGDLMRRTELCSGATASQPDARLAADDIAAAYVKRCSWRVGDAMTADPVTIDEDASVARVAKILQERGIKRVPVTRNGELVGIVSRRDLLQAILSAPQDNMPAGDEAIRRSVLVRLGENTGLEGLDVTATVSDGVVHLWGKVETAGCRRAARLLAENVRGVRGVVEHFPDPYPQ
jgi:CBS-domain-containing membrane protein